MKIDKGQKVRLHYTGTLDDGSVFDSSKDREPLEFVSGAGMVIKGFDDAVMGMEEGEEKKFTIESKDAYGEVVKELVQEVPIEAFGKEKPEIGVTIGIKTPEGEVMPAKIISIKDNKVSLDLNHPLAGKRLTFEIKIVDAKSLSKEDMEALSHHHHHGHDCGDACEHEHRHGHSHENEEKPHKSHKKKKDS